MPKPPVPIRRKQDDLFQELGAVVVASDWIGSDRFPDYGLDEVLDGKMDAGGWVGDPEAPLPQYLTLTLREPVSIQRVTFCGSPRSSPP